MELVLYGLNEAGEPAFAERLASERRADLAAIAAARLAEHPMVEIWDGPVCVLRVRRRSAGPA